MARARKISKEKENRIKLELFRKKNRLVYQPFFVMVVCFFCLYTLLDWWLVVETGILPLKRDLVHYVLPLALPWIPILIWLRPRIRLLKFPVWRRRLEPDDLYYFMAWFVMAVPTVITQGYMEKTVGRLTSLDNIHSFYTVPATKYYTLEEYYVDFTHPGYSTKSEYTGRYSRNIRMTLYIVAPIRSDKDTVMGVATAWFGKRYHKLIAGNSSEVQKKAAFHSLVEVSERKFRYDCRNPFQYLQREGYSDDDEGYRAATHTSPAYTPGNDTVLIPVDKPFNTRTEYQLLWIFITLGGGLLGFLAMVHAVPFDKKKLHSVVE